jgi:hypothetical protein
MIKKLRNQPYAPKWEQRGRKKIMNTHSNRPVTLMWHFDTRSNATDLKFNEVAGPFDYG